jgi:hypothetical protein
MSENSLQKSMQFVFCHYRFPITTFQRRFPNLSFFAQKLIFKKRLFVDLFLKKRLIPIFGWMETYLTWTFNITRNKCFLGSNPSRKETQ